MLPVVRSFIRPIGSRFFSASSLTSHYFARVQKQAPFFSGGAVVDGTFKNASSALFLHTRPFLIGKWLVLFFYPLDFTFVCPTEIIEFSERAVEFKNLGCDVIGCSVDSKHSHLAWVNQPRKEGGLVSDITKQISNDYGVLVDEGSDMGLSLRGTFIIDPKQIVRHISINDLGVGRSVDETLRLVEAFQFNDKHGEVCPAGWKKGAKTMIADPAKSKEYFKAVN
ncbi:C-terminal domain of 1-Cys peroxiredoxin [Entophlyctis luteolus]|nr:C-terminal domain of 1-Cys peroxiredoxin [Entophlyctis luteolus]KAJ3355551.1 C-terminal domain of 1-Cys peroxiredoxin [Entophlyctis luteolus]